LRPQERLAGIEAGITHPNIKPNGPPILAPPYQAMAWLQPAWPENTAILSDHNAKIRFENPLKKMRPGHLLCRIKKRR
tara:strand:+ start:251 stop:484 length:234 start_codon:yes stop_codon:yes gene_type:complete